MNLIFRLAVLWRQRRGDRRRCPNCGLTNRVSSERRHQVVRCSSCRTVLPADPDRRRD